MEKPNEFYTMKGYQLNEDISLTSAMEDYLEMICRMLQKNGCVRINDLSKRLNVRPSSTSKMVQQLSAMGYLHAEKYGVITATEKGKAAGNYLLYRHDVVYNFLCALKHSDNELEETEKIEHFLSVNTVQRLDALTQRLLAERSVK